ncbi:hypothetical protein Acr_15g0009470 [Actinidia rufa]|uniref:Uncharacterized protein n=1 Tax=Actinidia rufa TaxID=165716 RepID=A0A7J0FUG0_9ERIC|nr:hypothetical protein Acr_15g0009470 [Actinidia rufa]
MGIMETKLNHHALEGIARTKFVGWRVANNFSHHPNGRILILWKEELVQLNIIETTDQVIHYLETCKISNVSFYISYVYAFNTAVGRRPLWHNLRRFNSLFQNSWILLGDFNNVLNNDERINGMPVTMYETREFKDCCYDLGLSNLRSSRMFHTWSNNKTWCKLDKAMGGSPFKFFNMWTRHKEFQDIVSNTWGMHVVGSVMFKLCKKLKSLKEPLKSLNKQHFSHISAMVRVAEEELAHAQQQLHDNTTDTLLQSRVHELRALKLAEAEASYCSQLAKAKYLKNCDRGSKFFHDLIKRLKISLSKSSFFSAGINPTDTEIIKRTTGFTQGIFPFKYLGIPVAASRLSGIAMPVSSPPLKNSVNHHYAVFQVWGLSEITSLCKSSSVPDIPQDRCRSLSLDQPSTRLIH